MTKTVTNPTTVVPPIIPATVGNPKYIATIDVDNAEIQKWSPKFGQHAKCIFC